MTNDEKAMEVARQLKFGTSLPPIINDQIYNETMENVTIKKNDFMRAVYFHKLNVHSTSHFHGKSLDIEWQLGDMSWVATWHTDNISTGIKTDYTCICSQNFYKTYVLTTPANAYHCATCKKRGQCKFEREDAERFCFGWNDQNE